LNRLVNLELDLERARELGKALKVFLQPGYLPAPGAQHSLLVDQIEDGLGVVSQRRHLLQVRFHRKESIVLPILILPDQDRHETPAPS
jgi:hypothetical protein